MLCREILGLFLGQTLKASPSTSEFLFSAHPLFGHLCTKGRVPGLYLNEEECALICLLSESYISGFWYFLWYYYDLFGYWYQTVIIRVICSIKRNLLRYTPNRWALQRREVSVIQLSWLSTCNCS